jgi:hypothetical protein
MRRKAKHFTGRPYRNALTNTRDRGEPPPERPKPPKPSPEPEHVIARRTERAKKTAEEIEEICVFLANEYGLEFVGPVPKTYRHFTTWRDQDGKEFQDSYQNVIARYRMSKK